MTKQQITKVVAFCLIVCIMLLCLCDLFEHNNLSNYSRRIHTYRTLEEDTVDAVFLGTSGVDRYWIAAKAYEEDSYFSIFETIEQIADKHGVDYLDVENVIMSCYFIYHGRVNFIQQQQY